MKLSIRWLERYVDLSGITPSAVGEALSMTTAEVEAVETVGPSLDKIVVAEVRKIDRHPNADRLVLVEATIGEGPLAIVCGATNLVVGRRVPLALPGAVLPDGTKIAKSKIRGVESGGMLCSRRELGLSDEHEGILLFEGAPALGAPVADVLGTGDSVLSFDHKSLTHRPDCWGHYGMARELAAIFERPLKPYLSDAELAALVSGKGPAVPAEVEDTEGCRRYSILPVAGLKVGPSPAWMKRDLEAVGLRPINNLVDVTNWVLFDLGQPLHAFDRRLLRGGKLFVRHGRPGERLKALDGIVRDCPAHGLLIADAERPLAFAGIMGGEESGITEATTETVLESANFDPIVTRRASQSLKLRSDSSLRFEKSIDPAWTPWGLARALSLLAQVSPGAEASGPMTDVYPKKASPVTVETTARFISERLGADVPAADSVALLSRLGFGASANGERIVVSVPSWRATKDVSTPEDIVEEVGRLYGYHRIPRTLPRVPASPPVVEADRRISEGLRDALAGSEGFIEVMNYTIANDRALADAGLLDAPAPRLKNSLDVEATRLRTSLAPGLLSIAKKNAKTSPAVRVFEVGEVAIPAWEKGSPWEESRLGGLLVARGDTEAIFREAKASLEAALQSIEAPAPSYAPDPAPPPWSAPGLAARVLLEGKPAGILAAVSPSTLASLEWRGAAGALFELSIPALVLAPRHPARYRPIPKFPPVTMDLAVVADEAVPCEDVAAAIREAGGGILADVRLFDLYRGAPLSAGRKSLAFTLSFLSANKTLSDKDVEKPFARIREAVKAKGWGIRENA
ncbi:MAG: phenylalanine--tRNA ligase subunit beta [Planctomycetota bacterium]